MANLAPLLGVQYFESLVYPNGQLPFWGSGTGVSDVAALTYSDAEKTNRPTMYFMISRLSNMAVLRRSLSAIASGLRVRLRQKLEGRIVSSEMNTR